MSRRATLWPLFQTIAAGDVAGAERVLAATPGLASEASSVGATRAAATRYFLKPIEHYVYAGDTPLHIAAGAYQLDIARQLLARAANPNARNRLGAQPLHYAAVGRPGSASWNPAAQAATIAYLIQSGADVHAADRSGVTALHRAIRCRCAAAVRVLLAHGADPRGRNKRGSTPFELANRTTGRGGSGSAEARQQQTLIIQLLAAHGAVRPPS